MRLVKIHGRGSWAIIQEQGQAKFEGRRSQVRAGQTVARVVGRGLGPKESVAAGQHHFRRMSSGSLPHPACAVCLPACLPACTCIAVLPVPQIDLKDKWRNLVKHDRIEPHHLEEIEVGGSPALAQCGPPRSSPLRSLMQ